MAVIIDSPDELADAVIKCMCNFAGFDDWWFCIDYDSQQLILQDLTYIIEEW